MKKKAQAAMEFLMTYGWAILVVLVVIGALAYFGVLNPKNLLPDKCLFGPGIGTCTDFQLTATSGVKLVLTNGFGEKITVDTISVKKAGVDTVICTGTPALPILPGSVSTAMTATCSPVLVAGEKVNLDVDITYKKGDGTLPHTISGQVSATVQA